MFNEVANTTTQTLSIAQRATDPQAQRQQLGFFYQTQTAIFREDCDAKAHQLTYLGQQLGGHPDIGIFQSFCSEIQPPTSITPPGR